MIVYQPSCNKFMTMPKSSGANSKMNIYISQTNWVYSQKFQRGQRNEIPEKPSSNERVPDKFAPPPILKIRFCIKVDIRDTLSPFVDESDAQYTDTIIPQTQ